MIDKTALLSQMQAMAQQAQGQKPEDKSSHEFSGLLKNALNEVNKSQEQVDQLKKAYDLGENVSLAEVMLAQQKANIELQALTQVRNKIINAYKEISNMQW